MKPDFIIVDTPTKKRIVVNTSHIITIESDDDGIYLLLSHDSVCYLHKKYKIEDIIRNVGARSV